MRKSTLEKPIRFFETYLSVNGINSLKREFYNSYIENENAPTIDYEHESVTYYSNAIGEDSIDGWKTEYFKSYLERKLRVEFEKSKNLIYEKIILFKTTKSDITGFLEWQRNVLEKIKDDNKSILNNYPISYCPINGLIKYINEQLDIDKIKPTDVAFEKAPVLAIFGFLKENNQSGQKIMIDSDFDRLVAAIQRMVDDEKFVPEEKQIPSIKIPNDLLRFCFYVLHKRMYGKRPQRTYFIDFMKHNFVQLENYQYETLKGGFANNPYSKYDAYIPDIIKAEYKSTKIVNKH